MTDTTANAISAYRTLAIAVLTLIYVGVSWFTLHKIGKQVGAAEDAAKAALLGAQAAINTERAFVPIDDWVDSKETKQILRLDPYHIFAEYLVKATPPPNHTLTLNGAVKYIAAINPGDKRSPVIKSTRFLYEFDMLHKRVAHLHSEYD